MISTITTSTVAAVAAVGLSTALGGIAVAMLIGFVAQREVAAAAGPRLRPLTRALSVAVAPLAIAFVAIVVFRMGSLL